MSEAAAAGNAGDNGSAGAGATNNAGTPQSWNAGFDEDTNAYVSNKGWQNPADVLNSYRNLEKFVGGSKNLLEMPGENADEAALNNFFNKLGRPESADKYNFNIPDGGDAQLTDWFRQTAHKNGLTDKQASAIFDAWNEMSMARVQSMQDEMKTNSEKDLENLRKEWGQGYDAQISAGKQAVKALGLTEEKLNEIEDKIGTSELLRLMATFGSKMGEDSFDGGDRSNAGFGLTPAAARQEIADLKLNKDFMAEYLKGNNDAVAKMKRLMEYAHG